MSRGRCFNGFALVTILLCAPMTNAGAQEFVNNWNTGACRLTDSATINVSQPQHMSRLELWYNWQPNESSVGYTVSFNGQQIGTGTLKRADCDPYQAAWCIARDTPEAEMSVGTYTFRTAHPRVCQNAGSGGQGFIRAYTN